jgi:hypothetical protein
MMSMLIIVLMFLVILMIYLTFLNILRIKSKVEELTIKNDSLENKLDN